MSPPPTFGSAPPGVACRPRPAAYAVIREADGRVAVVRGKAGYWLPGGGADPGETPEETITREVREELGRPVRILARLGEAVQYFHAADDACWYEMTAVFFHAALDDTPAGPAEYPLEWIDPAGVSFFHPCHAWAVARAREGATDRA